ncbi:unnamed protein product [Closterium sp. Naga37s-1]|nr:unnamed protein product [Closterium sp. Naga37s-1]
MAERMDAMHSAIHSSGDDRSNGASVSAASPRTDGDISAESLRDLHASAAEPLLGSSRSSASASASPLVKRSAAAATSAYEPIENGNVAATSTSVPMREVHVDLYIRGRGKSGKGKGPACSFAAQLLGWHADRLDVAAIKRRGHVRAGWSSGGESAKRTVADDFELAKRSVADESRPMGNRGGRLRGQVGGEFAAGWAGVQGDGGGGVGGRFGQQGFSSSPFAFFSSPSLCQPLPACFPLTLSRPSPLPFSLFPHLLSSPFAYSPTSPTSFPSGAFLESLPGGSRGSSLRPWSAAPHHPPQPHLATLLATSALLSTSPNVPYQEPFLSRSLVAAGVLLFALALLLLLVSHNPHFATLLANSPFLPPSPHLFHRPSHQEPFLSRSLVAAGGLLFSLGLLLIPLQASPILSLSSSLYHLLPPGAFLESLPGGSRGSALFPWSASPSRLPQPPLCQPACNA